MLEKITHKEFSMKQIQAIFYVLMSAVFVWVLLSSGLPKAASQRVQAAPAPAAQPACDASRSVQVSGTAVINVPPDRALIQLGVQSNGNTVDAAEKANSSTIQAVIAALRRQGADAKDITTDWYVIDPVYEDYDSLYIKGYRIHNLVAVTVRDVSQTSPLIAAALRAGANQVVNVDLYTSELRKYRDQARELAMKAAHEKAQALAQAAGSEAGCVLTIQENSWSGYNGWWYGNKSSQNQWTQNVMQNAAPTGGAGGDALDGEPISLGQISVRAEINASFALK